MSGTSAELPLEPISLTPISLLPAVHVEADPARSTTPTRAETSRGSRGSGERVGDIAQPPNCDTSKGVTAAVIASVTCATGISSLLSGLVTVSIPTIAEDLALDDSLLLWPASIFALTCGCTLLLSGSVADLVGSRVMYLTGCSLQSAFTLASGLSRTGFQLIVFRALAGIAVSFCLPSAVSIVTNSFPPGPRRNMAFASMGGGQPIGFSLGLTLGGCFASVGWRWGFHLTTTINTAILALTFWKLPKPKETPTPVTWHRLFYDIDWIGGLIASASLGMMSCLFALLTNNTSQISTPASATLLGSAVALIPAFIFWVGRQERLSRPAIIPNSLWRNKIFTCICLNVFLGWGALNAIETFVALFFQYVQHLTPIESSLRFLPAPISGTLTNIVMGLIVHRARADVALVVAIVLGLASPLLLALIQPEWSYWAVAGPAMFLTPIGADALYTISNLVITSVFPASTQGLAGGVFNTISQIGKSVGLASSAMLASSITLRSKAGSDKTEALLDGYHATWWYCAAMNATVLAICLLGLKGIGKVGLKRD